MQQNIEEISPIKERILYFINKQGYKIGDFLTKAGIKYSNFKGKSQKSELGGDKIAKIIAAYPEISPEWLLTGCGDMLQSPKGQNAASMGTNRGTVQIGENYIINREDITEKFPNGSVSVRSEVLDSIRGSDCAVAEKPGEYRVSRIVEPSLTPKGVPYYDVDFLCGFDMVFNDQTRNPIGYIDLPQYSRADAWANISGHSMEPVISNGDIIALRRIHDWKNFLLFGEIYGIITENYRTVKRVRKSPNPDCLILEPINKDGYDEQEIPKEMILDVWQVIGSIKKLF